MRSAFQPLITAAQRLHASAAMSATALAGARTLPARCCAICAACTAVRLLYAACVVSRDDRRFRYEHAPGGRLPPQKKIRVGLLSTVENFGEFRE